MKSTPGKIELKSQELFNEGAEVTVPRLMRERKAPHRVAPVFDVSPNAVRSWLTFRGWTFDPQTGAWIEPLTETQHA